MRRLTRQSWPSNRVGIAADYVRSALVHNKRVADEAADEAVELLMGLGDRINRDGSSR